MRYTMNRSTVRRYDRIVTGVDEVDQMLRTMKKVGTANRIARATLSPALSHLVRAMRRGAPKKSFKPAIRKTNKYSKHQKRHQAKVGINVGLKQGDQRTIPQPLWWILGTEYRSRGNKLRQDERPQGPRGKRGKRGIGGRFAFLEPLTRQGQYKRRTGRMSPHTSFIQTIGKAASPALPKIMLDAYHRAAKKEAQKHRVGKVTAT